MSEFVQPTEEQLQTLSDNYTTGAIDLVTFMAALEDLYQGVPNTYAQARYRPDEEN